MYDKQYSCLICCENKKFIKHLACQCLLCIECLNIYLKIIMEKISFSLESSIKCPGVCNTLYSIDNILSISKQNGILQEVDSYLLKKYLISAQDIQQCPIEKCQYTGILPSKSCSDLLLCEKCGINQSYEGNEWICLKLLPMKYRMQKHMINIYQTRQFLTDLNQILFSNTCPKCDIPIYRTGGCQHMTCIKCLHEFCWYCKQVFQDHNLDQCFFHSLVYYGIYSSMIFNILLYLNLHIVMQNLIHTLFIFFWWFYIHNSVYFFIAFVLKYSFDLLFYLKNQLKVKNFSPNQNRKKTEIYLILSLLSLIMYLNILNYFTEITLCSWLFYMVYEGCFLTTLFGFGMVFYKFGDSIYKNWLKQVL